MKIISFLLAVLAFLILMGVVALAIAYPIFDVVLKVVITVGGLWYLIYDLITPWKWEE